MPTRPALKMGITLPAFNSLDFISSNKKPLISDDELKEALTNTKYQEDKVTELLDGSTMWLSIWEVGVKNFTKKRLLKLIKDFYDEDEMFENIE